MLEKNTRKRFSEQNWYDILSNEKNRYQFTKRIRAKVNSAMTDLAIIGKRLPDEEFEKIFDLKTFSTFLQGVIIFESDPDHKPVTRRNNYKILMMLIEYGLLEFIASLKEEHGNVPSISKVLTDQLEESYVICKHLTLNIERTELENEALEKNLIYLFKRRDLYSEQNSKAISNMVMDMIGKDKISKYTKNPRYVDVLGGNILNQSLNDILIYTARIVETTSNQDIGKVELKFDKRELECKLMIKLLNDKPIIERLTVIEGIDEYYFYRKKNFLTRKR